MRKDKAKNIIKVAKEKLINPLATQKEIADKLGVGEGTVNRATQELDSSGLLQKDEDIIRIADSDKRIVELSQFISESSMISMIESVEQGLPIPIEHAQKASQIARDSTARYTFLKGTITDKEGGLKKLESGYELLAQLQAGTLPRDKTYDALAASEEE